MKKMSTNYSRGVEQGGRPTVAPGGMCRAGVVSLTLQPSGRDASGTVVHGSSSQEGVSAERGWFSRAGFLMVGPSFDPHRLLQDRLLLIGPHPHSHFYLLVKGSIKRASQVALVVKNSPDNAGHIRDVGLISGLGRSPGGGNGNPFPFLPGKSMDRGAWWATVPGMAKSLTQLSN